MRFVMLGAGAIGGVVGGQLAKAGFDVLFVDPLRGARGRRSTGTACTSAASTGTTCCGCRR